MAGCMMKFEIKLSCPAKQIIDDFSFMPVFVKENLLRVSFSLVSITDLLTFL